MHVHEVAARAAVHADWPEWVDPSLLGALLASGIENPWSHQVEVARHAHAGRHVVVSTGTASGKSLGYHLPILSDLVAGASAPNGRGATALYLSPTKALAADQLSRIDALALPAVRPATYDGDTPTDERRWIRDHANLVLTNPDLLHHSLLPGHERWSSFLRALRYVVVDECHVYKGVFGSHLAAVLRRLRRVAARYRSTPTFVFASATVADPEEHASRLLGLPVAPVTVDGSPRASMTFALWEPPLLVDETGQPKRVSTITETGELLAGCVREQVQTVAFARSRAGVEVVARIARERVSTSDEGRVAAYRGGFLPEERRELERSLRSRELLGLAATNALELGVDVSGLDAVLLAGWPGTLSSLWQQAGRAGRSGERSLAVLVAADDPLDTFVVHHPEAIFGRGIEATVVDPDNPHVLAPHLAAAAAELPSPRPTSRSSGPRRGRCSTRSWPAASSRSARAAGSGAGRTVRPTTSRSAGRANRPHRRDADRARRRHRRRRGRPQPGAHGRRAPAPGADVGRHRARPRRPRGLRRARRPRLDDAGAVGERLPDRPRGGARAVGTPALLLRARDGAPPGDLVPAPAARRGGARRAPPRPPAAVARDQGGVVDDARRRARRAVGVAEDGIPGAAHAAEHAAIGMLPLFATADRWDIGGVSTALHPDTGLPTILIYDGHPGGRGSPSAATAGCARGWAPRARRSRRASARPAAPRASSRPSAATATSRSTSRARSRCST